MFNGVALNPAYTGSEEALSIVSSNRIQWLGFDGAPQTLSLSAHAPLNNKKIAVGMQVFADQIGVDRKVGVFPSLAYRLRLKKAKLSMGISAGVHFKKSFLSQLDVLDAGDSQLISDSPLGVLPDLSLGGHYYTDNYFISLSVPMLLTHNFENNRFVASNQFDNYNFMLGGGIVLERNKIKFKPSTLLKYRISGQFQADLNIMMAVNKIFEFGISYRTNEAIVGLIEFKPNDQLSVMYSYGAPLSNIGRYTSGSHELGLKYNFMYKGKIAGPRFLGW
jgi:type IX secretion system PorP/SprF family membrane protein